MFAHQKQCGYATFRRDNALTEADAVLEFLSSRPEACLRPIKNKLVLRVICTHSGHWPLFDKGRIIEGSGAELDFLKGSSQQANRTLARYFGLGYQR